MHGVRLINLDVQEDDWGYLAEVIRREGEKGDHAVVQRFG